jgi:hypothetical protein
MTAESNRTFTSLKLDWLRCLAFDRRVGPLAFEVGFCIIQHANARTGRTWRISDETIADEIGCPARSVYRARSGLRAAGWLAWTRTRNANIYKICFGNVERVLDLMTAARDARKERQKMRQSRLRECASVRTLEPPDCAPMRTQDCAPMRNKHLRHNTVKNQSSYQAKTGTVERASHVDFGRAQPSAAPFSAIAESS